MLGISGKVLEVGPLKIDSILVELVVEIGTSQITLTTHQENKK